jgi:hypothetical protein
VLFTMQLSSLTPFSPKIIRLLRASIRKWEVPEKIVNELESLEACADQRDSPGVHTAPFASDISMSICKI